MFKLLKKAKKGSYTLPSVDIESDSGYTSVSAKRKAARKSFDPRDLGHYDGYSSSSKSKLSLYNDVTNSSPEPERSGFSAFLKDDQAIDRNGNKVSTLPASVPVTKKERHLSDPSSDGSTPPPAFRPRPKKLEVRERKQEELLERKQLITPTNKRKAPAPPRTDSLTTSESVESLSVTSGPDPVFSSPSEDETAANHGDVETRATRPLDMAAESGEFHGHTLVRQTTLSEQAEIVENSVAVESAVVSSGASRPSRPTRPPVLPRTSGRQRPLVSQRRNNSQVHSTVITSSSSTITIQIKNHQPEAQKPTTPATNPQQCRVDVKYMEEEGVVTESSSRRSSAPDIPLACRPTPPPRRSKSRPRLGSPGSGAASFDMAELREKPSVQSFDQPNEAVLISHLKPGTVQLRNSPVLDELVTEDEDFSTPPEYRYDSDILPLESGLISKSRLDKGVVPHAGDDAGHHLEDTGAGLDDESGVFEARSNMEDSFDVDDVVEEGPDISPSGPSTPGTSTPVHPRTLARRNSQDDKPLPPFSIGDEPSRHSTEGYPAHRQSEHLKHNYSPGKVTFRHDYENVAIRNGSGSVKTPVQSSSARPAETLSNVPDPNTLADNLNDGIIEYQTPIRERSFDVTANQSLPGRDVMGQSVLVEEDYNTPEISALTFLQSPDGILDSPGTDFEPTSYPWEHKPVRTWDADDIIEWCQAKDLEDVADKIHGIITNGAQLLHLAARDLDILKIEDEDTRRRFLDELQALQQIANTSPSLWKLRRVSVRRKTLEISGDLIRQRLYNLQQLNEQQQSNIDSSISVLQEEQRSTDELLQGLERKQAEDLLYGPPLDKRLSSSTESLTTSSSTRRHRRHSSIGDSTVEEIVSDIHKNYQQLPLSRWNNADVLHWLSRAGLARFIPNFKDHNICGRDLAEVNMKLLDSINIRTVEDRELLLSKLYELQHPQNPSLQHIISASLDRQTEPEARLKPRRIAQDHPVSTINVWHDLKGKLVCHPTRASENTTTSDVIRAVLKEFNVTDDPNIYYLVVCDDGGDGLTRELRATDNPLTLLRTLKMTSSHRFELRMRATSTIRVVCHVTDMKPRGKVIKIAPLSTCSDVLMTSLRKFHLQNMDPEHFGLLEVNPSTGALRQLHPREVMYELESDAFIFYNTKTDRMIEASTEQHQDNHQVPPPRERLPIEGRVPEPNPLERVGKQLSLPVLPSGDDSPQGGAQPPIKKSASSDMDRYVTPRKQKLISGQALENLDPESVDKLELLRELALMKESVIERDKSILRLAKENKKLKSEVSDSSQHSVLPKSGSLKSGSLKPQDQRRSVSMQNLTRLGSRDSLHRTGSRDSLDKVESEEIKSLTKELRDVSFKVQKQEEQRQAFTKELEVSDQNGMNPKRQDQLKRAMSSIELDLLNLKQTHAQVFAQLEVARNNNEKKKDALPANNCLFELLQGGSPQVILGAEVDSSHVLVTKDDTNRHVIKHAQEDCGLEKKDRIIEVNGIKVLEVTDAEVSAAIRNAKQTLKLVVLRDYKQPTRGGVTDEEVAGMREDLSLAMIEMEALSQDNKDLTRDLTELRRQMGRLKEENEKIRLDKEHLYSKLTNSETQWQELRTVLRKMQDGDLNPLELDMGKAYSLDAGRHPYKHTNGHPAGQAEEQSAGKGYQAEVLQVLKDHLLETQQQRAYLSSLMTLVVAHAPHLILKVDREVRSEDDVKLKKQTKEYC